MRVFLLAALAALLSGSALASSEREWGRCSNERRIFAPEVSIAACDVIIARGGKDSTRLAVAYSHRGLAYGRQGDHSRAIDDNTKAIHLNPSYALAYTRRGIALGFSGDTPRAWADLTRAISLDPRLALAYQNRAVVYEKKRDLVRAVEDYRTALSLPANSEVHEQARKGLIALGITPPAALRRTLPGDGPPHKEPQEVSSGSGLVLSTDGKIITNAHVVQRCPQLTVQTLGRAAVRARVLATDERNDLALLQADQLPHDRLNPRPIRRDPRLGETVYSFSYPLSGYLASSGNFTSGLVTGNAGLRDDTSKFQFSAPVQPGSSGAAVFDKAANVLGIIMATLKVAGRTELAPQNVNFAIRGDVVIAFLRAHGILPAIHDPDARTLTAEEVADHASVISVRVHCGRA